MNSSSSKTLSPDELRLLGEAVDSSTSPLTLYDSNFGVIYANPIARSLWPETFKGLENGLSIQEATKSMVKSLLPEQGEVKIQDAANTVLAAFHGNRPVSLLATQGRWIEMTYQTIRNRVIVGMGVEISELKAHQAALVKAQKVQAQTLEALEHGILIVDNQGIVTQFNTAYQEYSMSRGAKVSLGMDLIDLAKDVIEFEKIDLGDVIFRDWFEDFFRSRFGIKDVEYQEEYSLPNGRHILWRQHYNEYVGNIITVTDITEIKNVQLRAEAAELAKSEFLANMSHEIRTPMNGVLGMAELLDNCNLEPKEKQYLGTIKRSGEALLTIINDILDFSRIEANRIKLDAAPFNLRDSIEDVVSLLSTAANEKDVDLLLRIQPNLPSTFIGDVGRFRQVITNIIGNAVKFTHEGSVLIAVTGQEIGDQAKLNISIEDTGIGIPEDQIPHIFDKFRQVDGSNTRKYEGTGLGLSISRQLINLMGGEINVRSKLDQGTLFLIELSFPISDEHIKTELVSGCIAGASVLVIDDNLVNRDILQEQLKYWKCKSVAVESSQRGLSILNIAKLKNIPIDLVIVDYQMPKETGENFVDQMKSNPDFKDIPVIMLTSVDEDGLESRLKEKGLDVYLTKPARASSLLESITHLICSENACASNPRRVSEPGKANDEANIIKFDTALEQVDVLVAEDNETNQMYLDYVLKETGLSYKIVGDGQQAIDAFKEIPPRLILMDISMPIVNGFEATQEIRKLETLANLPSTPIVAVTAHAMKEDRDRCLAKGMDDYLSKPLSVDRLENVLKKWGLMSFPEKAKASA